MVIGSLNPHRRIADAFYWYCNGVSSQTQYVSSTQSSKKQPILSVREELLNQEDKIEMQVKMYFYCFNNNKREKKKKEMMEKMKDRFI